jgi:hypothetical protein
MPVAFVPPASASNAAFYTIFGIFVVAMLVLIVIIIVWAVRHDVAGRAAWRERQQAAAEATGDSLRQPWRRPQPEHDPRPSRPAPPADPPP